LASQRMVLIFESTLGILRVNVAMLTNHQWCIFLSSWAIRWSQQVTYSSLISKLMTLHFWTFWLWIVAYLCIKACFLLNYDLTVFSCFIYNA
jgi:hypothetical protein